MKKLLALLVFAASLIISINIAYAQGGDKPFEKLKDLPKPESPRESNVNVCSAQAPGFAKCLSRVVTEQSGKVKTNSTPSGYGPAQFLGAYALSGTASGSPIIAIVDAYDQPYIQSDLNKYSLTFGIPTLPACGGPIDSSAAPCFQKVDQRGGTRYPRADSGWGLEISLDVQVAHAVCQNCRILLVEADSSSYTNLMSAVDRARLMGANVVSNSYGSNEFSSETTYDSHFNYPNIAFTFSSGDSGYGAGYPAASRFVTAVGGTSLYINPDNSYNSESAWSGTGSGCSSFESKPSWQKDPGCAKRTIADVSADADPTTGAAVYDSLGYGGTKGWFKVGGTSLSSPLIAGVYALSGNYGASGNPANSLPYNFPINLHDILSGSNGNCGSYLCNAGGGYDGPTGMGTPKGASAF